VGKPGSAPLRVTTLYEQLEKDHPGTQPRIHTLPNDEDVQDIIEDIKKLRPQVDVLVWSCHWGVHFVPKVLADYQIKIGHMVIDAGADLILGHHPHLLHAVEVYKGKVILYSMGTFAFDSQLGHRLEEKSKTSNKDGRALMKRYGWEGRDPEYPTFDLPAICRKNIIVKCFIDGNKIRKVTLVTALVNKKGQPEPLSARSESGNEIVKLLEESSKDFNTRLSVEDDEVLVMT
jgi:poly-gamma-glutamate synthesis protein (capsule biosynthesis protein)